MQPRNSIIAARRSFLRARAAELSQLRQPVPPGSFSMTALERVISRVEDELRWIGQLESSIRVPPGRKPKVES